MANLKLSNYKWYHGPITRQAAQAALFSDGDFLVRDCISNPGRFLFNSNSLSSFTTLSKKPILCNMNQDLLRVFSLFNRFPSNSGDYVLTCMADGGKALHFKLNKVRIEENTWYQFEGEPFQSVQELIDHHISTKLPISGTSKATIVRPIVSNSHATKLNPDRSQSSMSGDTTASTTSSGTSTQMTKSGSRASLLKDQPRDDNSTAPCELKRFKSLPAGRIRKKVKRRAPSPPKDIKPFNVVEAKNSHECQEDVDQPQPRKPPNFLEGVKLRRKKFSHLLPKPLNLRQRQSMHVTAHLHEYVKKSLPSR